MPSDPAKPLKFFVDAWVCFTKHARTHRQTDRVTDSQPGRQAGRQLDR